MYNERKVIKAGVHRVKLLTDWLAFIKPWQNERSAVYNRPNIG